jgi:hypothetical protein
MVRIKHPMLISNTPIEDHREEFGLWVKREDLSCFEPGPPFSKTRGVYAHVKSRPEKLIGVLDTAHSQAGHAVARACQILGKDCINFYPVYKREVRDDGTHEFRPAQAAARALGARLFPLTAGRSCILYHAAKKHVGTLGGYLMPNALKLSESVTETAKEVPNIAYARVLLPCSSGTIAAGVIQGFEALGLQPEYILHLGYSRSHDQVLAYIREASGVADFSYTIVDEGYAYKDRAKPSVTPPWPCNAYYDLKAFRWWMRSRSLHSTESDTLMWNIG